jgi:2-oxoglutarate dehydrogenase E1 component
VQEIVIGMAHRGRLNVLVNTLGKMPKDLFAEFDHTAPEDLPAGDVKYHQGFSSDVSTPGGPVHLSLAFNPSHLEIVNPVVEGSVRARMDRRGDPKGKQVLPVLVHGDAAFAGQGVNQETLALAQTRGYTTGGTVHIIINNQIGFTTSDPRDMRSTCLHRHREDGRVAGAARQWRRSRSRRAGHAAGPGIPHGVPPGRGGGHHLLPQAGPQRAGHPMLTQPLMYKKIAASTPARASCTPTSWPPKAWRDPGRRHGQGLPRRHG